MYVYIQCIYMYSYIYLLYMHSLSGRIHNKLIILIISEEEKLVARVKSAREVFFFLAIYLFVYFEFLYHELQYLFKRGITSE